MIKGNIVEKFEALGYDELDRCSEKQTFRNKKLGVKGEIDLFIENGDIAILIEVKTSLERS
jgi:Holliday junction resolvase-like predicted endonuclease